MNKIIDNASKLSSLFVSRAQFKADIQKYEDRIAAREIAITPFDGWPGKNEGERTVSKARACLIDEEMVLFHETLRFHQNGLGHVQAEIDGLNADTSAIEFTIRDETNRVMGGRSVLDIVQDCAMEAISDEVLSEDVLTEDEVKQIDADYAEHVRQQEEAEAEAQHLLEKDQLNPDFEPGSVDDPSSPNYIPF